jgi:acetate kinase
MWHDNTSIASHPVQARGMTADTLATLLYEQLGVSGLSGDMHMLNARAHLCVREAVDVFCDYPASGIAGLPVAS